MSEDVFEQDVAASRRRDREREIQMAAAAAVPPFAACVEIASGLAFAVVDCLTPRLNTAESRMLLVERVATAFQAAATQMLVALETDRRAQAGDPVAQARVQEGCLRAARTGRPV